MVRSRIGGGIRRFIPLPERKGRRNPKPLWFKPWTELDPHDKGNFHRVRSTGLSSAIYAVARLRHRRIGQMSFFGHRLLLKRKRRSLMAIPFWGPVVQKTRKQ